MSSRKPIQFFLLFMVVGWACTPGYSPRAQNGIRVVWSQYRFPIAKAINRVDVTNDGRPEIISFEVGLSNDKKGVMCLIEIIEQSATKNDGKPETLWKSSHVISFEGMATFLGTEGEMNFCNWVKEFFSGKLDTGAHFIREKLEPGEIQEKYIEEFAAKNGTNKQAIMKMILEQKENTLLIYPKEWEYYAQLVYLPKLHRFCQYDEKGYE